MITFIHTRISIELSDDDAEGRYMFASFPFIICSLLDFMYTFRILKQNKASLCIRVELKFIILFCTTIPV